MPEDEVTVANREARRHPDRIRQIVQAIEAPPPFEPHSIGTVGVKDLLQLKLRAATIERLERKRQELDYEIQLLRVESASFVTLIGPRYGCPVGGQVSIDSETGDIRLIAIMPVAEIPPEDPTDVIEAPPEELGPAQE